MDGGLSEFLYFIPLCKLGYFFRLRICWLAEIKCYKSQLQLELNYEELVKLIKCFINIYISYIRHKPAFECISLGSEKVEPLS